MPYVRRSGNKVPGDLRDVVRPLSASGEEVVSAFGGRRRTEAGISASIVAEYWPARASSRCCMISEVRNAASQLPGRRGSILARLLTSRASFLRNENGQRTAFRSQYASAVESFANRRRQGDRSWDSRDRTTDARIQGCRVHLPPRNRVRFRQIRVIPTRHCVCFVDRVT